MTIISTDLKKRRRCTQPKATVSHLGIKLNIMKKLCLAFLALILALPGLAQSEKGFVYLKNGSILKGRYIYSEDHQKISIQSAGNLWIFDASEIDSISAHKGRTMQDFNSNQITSSFFYRIEAGVLKGNSDNSQKAPFSLTGSVNYQVAPRFSVGAGLGVEFLKESYLPVFANFEYRLRESSSSPYLFLKAGYQVPLENSNEIYYDVYPLWMSSLPWPYYGEDGFDCKGGFLINPGVGYQQMFSRNFGMNFAVGYQFHRLNYSADDGDYELDIDYNRLTIKFGIIFN